VAATAPGTGLATTTAAAQDMGKDELIVANDQPPRMTVLPTATSE